MITMQSVSCTVTVGVGSEKHNHDLDYRATLEHVHGSKEDVIELVPYKSYKEKINALLKPYIDEYNDRVQQRYLEAWDRYNRGEIKTKPRKRDYKKIDYDYYEEHKNDTYFNRKTQSNEPLPIWRSMIFGLGDKADREKGIIKREQAEAVMQAVIDSWDKEFPDFKLLGATIHEDEDGFFHCHIDYKPLYEMDCGQGLKVGIGHEGALEHMGFEAEQSFINASDKIPIRFNAFRNRVYQIAEKEMHNQGLLLEYGVSKRKEPDKDSSKNQNLANWQATQDAGIEAKKLQNNLINALSSPTLDYEQHNNALDLYYKIQEEFRKLVSTSRTRKTKSDEVIVSFHIFDQMKSYVKDFINIMEHLFHRVDLLSAEVIKRDKEIEDLKKNDKSDELIETRIELRETREQAEKFRKIAKKQQTYLKEHNTPDGSKTLFEDYKEYNQTTAELKRRQDDPNSDSHKFGY